MCNDPTCFALVGLQSDGSGVDVHINLGTIDDVAHSESQRRLDVARRMLQRANRALDRIDVSTGVRMFMRICISYYM